MSAKVRYIFTLPPGAPVTVRVFSPPDVGDTIVQFMGRTRFILQHWANESGVMCRLDKCGLCKKPGPAQRLIGFTPALVWRASHWQDWARVAFQLTESLLERTADNVLIGTTWRIWRDKGDSGKTECMGEEIADAGTEALPPEFDITAAVCTAYKVNEVCWVDAPARPPRVVLLPVNLPPPPNIKQPASPAEPKQKKMVPPEALKAWKEKHGLRNIGAATKEQLAEIYVD